MHSCMVEYNIQSCKMIKTIYMYYVPTSFRLVSIHVGVHTYLHVYLHVHMYTFMYTYCAESPHKMKTT